MKRQVRYDSLCLITLAAVTFGCDDAQAPMDPDERRSAQCSPEYLEVPADCVLSRDGHRVDGDVPFVEIDYDHGEDYVSGYQDDEFVTTRLELDASCLGSKSVDVGDTLLIDGPTAPAGSGPDAHPEPEEQSPLQVTDVSTSSGVVTAHVDEVGIGDLQANTRQINDAADAAGKAAKNFWNDLVDEMESRTNDFLNNATTIDQSYDYNNGFGGVPATARFTGHVRIKPSFSLSDLHVKWLERKLTSLTATLSTEMNMSADFELTAGPAGSASASRQFKIADSGWQNHRIGIPIFGIKLRYRLSIDAEMTATASAGFTGSAGISVTGTPVFETSFSEGSGWDFTVSDPPTLSWNVPQVAKTNTELDATMELRPRMVFEVAGEKFGFDLVGLLTFKLQEPDPFQAEVTGTYSLEGKATMQWKNRPPQADETLDIVPQTTKRYQCQVVDGVPQCALPS